LNRGARLLWCDAAKDGPMIVGSALRSEVPAKKVAVSYRSGRRLRTGGAVSLNSVTAGPDVPDLVNVVIEIPANTGPVKYEVDKFTGAVFVDRFLSTSMFYPCNYGYVPQTLAADGDPLDVAVVTPEPLLPGSVIPCRLVGVLHMEDEAGDDAKCLGVPADHLTPLYRHIRDIGDVSEHLRSTIEHFFVHYKDLEEGKWVKTRGWGDAADACKALEEALAQYRSD
jgi:inorganic pyrophosphatase